MLLLWWWHKLSSKHLDGLDVSLLIPLNDSVERQKLVEDTRSFGSSDQCDLSMDGWMLGESEGTQAHSTVSPPLKLINSCKKVQKQIMGLTHVAHAAVSRIRKTKEAKCENCRHLSRWQSQRVIVRAQAEWIVSPLLSPSPTACRVLLSLFHLKAVKQV